MSPENPAPEEPEIQGIRRMDQPKEEFGQVTPEKGIPGTPFGFQGKGNPAQIPGPRYIKKG